MMVPEDLKQSIETMTLRESAAYIKERFGFKEPIEIL